MFRVPAAKSYDSYELELTAAKILTVISAIGISSGVGIGVNPLADHPPGPAAQQTALAVGVIGVVSGMAAAVLWPSEPDLP